jgi:hypothetical protein
VNESDGTELRLAVLDRSRSVHERMVMVKAMSTVDPAGAKETILQLCQRHDEPDMLLKLGGEELSRLLGAGEEISPFELREMLPIAFDAFSSSFKGRKED